MYEHARKLPGTRQLKKTTKLPTRSCIVRSKSSFSRSWLARFCKSLRATVSESYACWVWVKAEWRLSRSFCVSKWALRFWEIVMFKSCTCVSFSPITRWASAREFSNFFRKFISSASLENKMQDKYGKWHLENIRLLLWRKLVAFSFLIQEWCWWK